MESGIDKLVLTTTDFTVDDFRNPELQTSLVLNGDMPHLYTDEGGNPIFAQKTYFNQEDGLVCMTINRNGLQVITNPSKHFHQYELMTDTRKLEQVGRNIEAVLNNVGVRFNLQEAKVSRLDLAKQAYVPQPVPLYGEAFKCMRAKRQDKKDYPTGFYFFNKQHEVCFYDKGLQLGMPGSLNFMRGEVRYKNTKTVQKLTDGIITFKDLQSCGEPHLTACYNKYLENQIFGPASQAPNLDDQLPHLLEMANFIRQLREASPKGWNGLFKSMYGVERIFELVGGVQGFKKVMEMAGVPRTSIANLIKKDKTLLQKKGFLDSRLGNVTVASMIQEVRTMFAA